MFEIVVKEETLNDSDNGEDLLIVNASEKYKWD